MRIRLVQRRSVWLPTALGWLLLLILTVLPPAFWCLWGESYLAVTDRESARVLIVEGWISDEGIAAAAEEFRRGDYHVILTAGGWTGEHWNGLRWDFAAAGAERLIRNGIPDGKVIAAPAPATESQRTYISAKAAGDVLRAAGLNEERVNVFTQGSHARRTRLVYRKALVDSPAVGVIAWQPSVVKHWWRSSGRSADFVKETVGFFFELLLSSGRL
jgi:uncharacterized SAM-binding protein YcdF (DUF218 family)